MMDALVSNKPEFVRLFVDNGADVADFLTYGRLQQLYRSVAPKSLLFDLHWPWPPSGAGRRSWPRR